MRNKPVLVDDPLEILKRAVKEVADLNEETGKTLADHNEKMKKKIEELQQQMLEIGHQQRGF